MKIRYILLRRFAVLLGCFAFFALGQTHGASIIANSENAETISEETLRMILSGKEKFWDSGDEILIAILRSDPEVESALTKYSGMTSMKFRNHWQRIVFSGRGKMPKMFNNAEDLAAFVKDHKGAIGIVPEEMAMDGLRTIDLGLFFKSYASGRSYYAFHFGGDLTNF